MAASPGFVLKLCGTSDGECSAARHRSGIATEIVEATGEVIRKRDLTPDERQLTLLDD